MPHGQVSELISAPIDVVFDLVHDYSRRLEWDTLLITSATAAGLIALLVKDRLVGEKSDTHFWIVGPAQQFFD
jgi:hypothetical protein